MRKSSATARARGGAAAPRARRFMDDVYRAMFQLEAHHPGAEMGLALALLRARVAADRRTGKSEDRKWLKTVGPICLKMIEDSLERRRADADTPQSCCHSTARS